MVTHGVYGLKIISELSIQLLNGAAGNWDEVSLSLCFDPLEVPKDTVEGAIGGDEAIIRIGAGSHLKVDRHASTARLHVSPGTDVDELIESVLEWLGAVFGLWAGRDTLHAGGLAVGGRVWAFVGAREAGKSSSLAMLATMGVPVLADDILVVDRRQTFAGPRCIDIRLSAVPWIPGAAKLPLVRGATRRRLSLPSAPAQLPLGGWVFLGWSNDTAFRRLPAAEALARIAAARGWAAAAPDPAAFLDYASLPAWEYLRPPDVSRLAKAANDLLEFFGSM